MRLFWIAAATFSAAAQTPDVRAMMAKVAENQARALEQRKSFVYHQKQLLRLVRGSGKVAREERREYTIAPDDRTSRKELTHFEGKYERHGRYIAYSHPGYEYKEMDIDGELIDSLSSDLTSDSKSRDGMSPHLFPLTAREQRSYEFTLKGVESDHGRQVYRVTFQPKPGGDRAWKGEAIIDAREYQPVQVTTDLAMHLPLVVKTLFGTNIKGLGFSIRYEKFDDVWFPVSYGGEFELRAAFLYKRTISISLANSDFQKTDVSSSIAYKSNDQ
jgi:hypothetical protein